MQAETPIGEGRQSLRFLLLYAMAMAGGSIAYVPFLTILLPLRVTAMEGDGGIGWLAYAAFAGAVAASVGNILFGWLSDRTGSRRPWILAGLVVSSLLLVTFSATARIEQIILLLVIWQVSLNMLLAPLSAWAGDLVPDSQKGTLGGLLSIAPAAGAGASVLITIPGLATAQERLVLVVVLVGACVLPALILGRPRPMPSLMVETPKDEAERRSQAASDLPRMWIARLLVQISESALFAYLLVWASSIDPAMTDARVSRIFGGVLVASIPLSMAMGRWADRSGRPFTPLILAASGAALGLCVMAGAASLDMALVGYVLFGLGASVFLSLHSAQVLRVLPRPSNRGRDLGFFNLTNTVPSLVMPWFALALVPDFGFSALFAVLAGLCACAAVLLVALRTRASP